MTTTFEDRELYGDQCGWCLTIIDLSDESGDTWVEADAVNLCRPCYDALMDGTEEDFQRRRVLVSHTPDDESRND
jgi:hypothetical protein